MDECVERFVAHVELTSAKGEELLMPEYRRLLTAIRNFIKERNANELKFEKSALSNGRSYASRANLCGLMDKIYSWLRQVPLVSFNGQNYDLHVMKAALVKCFSTTVDGGKEETSIEHVIKKQEALACIATDRLRIIDMVSIIGVDKYLKVSTRTTSISRR